MLGRPKACNALLPSIIHADEIQRHVRAVKAAMKAAAPENERRREQSAEIEKKLRNSVNVHCARARHSMMDVPALLHIKSDIAAECDADEWKTLPSINQIKLQGMMVIDRYISNSFKIEEACFLAFDDSVVDRARAAAMKSGKFEKSMFLSPTALLGLHTFIGDCEKGGCNRQLNTQQALQKRYHKIMHMIDSFVDKPAPRWVVRTLEDMISDIKRTDYEQAWNRNTHGPTSTVSFQEGEYAPLFNEFRHLIRVGRHFIPKRK
jgi:hypothetical protein